MCYQLGVRLILPRWVCIPNLCQTHLISVNDYLSCQNLIDRHALIWNSSVTNLVYNTVIKITGKVFSGTLFLRNCERSVHFFLQYLFTWDSIEKTKKFKNCLWCFDFSGGTLAGYISDKYRIRGLTCVVFLIAAAPLVCC